MANSAVVTFEFQAMVLDQAPGSPSLVTIGPQLGDQIPMTILLPTNDFDNSPLSGLTHLNVATNLMVDGANPFIGLGVESIKGFPTSVLGVSSITPADAGTTKDLSVAVLAAGQIQAFAMWVDDDAT